MPGSSHEAIAVFHGIAQSSSAVSGEVPECVACGALSKGDNVVLELGTTWLVRA